MHSMKVKHNNNLFIDSVAFIILPVGNYLLNITFRKT